MVGPRHTTNPSGRVVSSVSVAILMIDQNSTRTTLTCVNILYNIIQHKVEQLVEAFERANYYREGQYLSVAGSLIWDK